MIKIAWHMLTNGETYRELGEDYYTRHHNPEQRARRLTRQLEQLGYDVDISPAA